MNKRYKIRAATHAMGQRRWEHWFALRLPWRYGAANSLIQWAGANSSRSGYLRYGRRIIALPVPKPLEQAFSFVFEPFLNRFRPPYQSPN